MGYIYGFTDANGDGFPDGLTFPEAGGGTAKGIVLPPCNGLVVRLRLSGLTDSDVRLSCGTLNDGSEGLLKARMSIRWPSDGGYDTEANRLQIDSDSVIDCDAMDVSFRGEVDTTPRRDGGTEVPTTIDSPFRRRWLHVYGFIGVASTSMHNPTNATDHLPCVSNSVSFHLGPNCPPITNLFVKAGWTHDTAVLWIRNLIRILTGDPKDDETDHCIGLVWSEGGSISLYDYLADCCKPYADKFTYYVNGSQCEGTLEFGDEPEEFHPTIFHVELRDEDGSETLDRMWVVVNAKIAEKHYNDWYSANSDTSWASALPKPYAKLQISTNWFGRVGATPLNPLNPDPWDSPSKLSGYLHHDSAWEMRSETDADDHGNQACYDGNGDIVRNGIAGGTADYYSGIPRLVRSHIREDVNPYLNALHLDGNPGDTEWNNDISRPCLYQGDYLNQYIERRPIIPPEGE
jgi:hypothetical protein